MNEDQLSNDSEFPDELISAYLDGELTPAEKVRVEEQLMDSAAHRQLFDELKSLRQSMQALPKQSLDADFSARVLQRAEKQLLTGDAEPAVDNDVQMTKRTAPVKGGSTADDRHSWRGLAWSVAAMAAAIMLIVFSPLLTESDPATGNRGVVVNTPPTESPDKPKQAPSDENAPLKTAVEKKAQEIASRDRAVDEQKQQAGQNLKKAKELAVNDRRMSAGASSSPADEQIDNSVGAPAALSLDHAIASQAGGNLEGLAKMRISAAESAVDGVAIDANRSTQQAFGGGSGNIAPPPSLTANLRQDALAGQFSQVPTNNLQLHSGQEVAKNNADTWQHSVDADATDMMVVSVDVTPEALASHFLDEMLAKHQIQTSPSQLAMARKDSAATEGGKRGGADHFEENQGLIQQNGQSEPQREPQRERLGRAELELANQAAKRDMIARRQREAGGEEKLLRQDARDMDVMVVVATPGQIENLLSDMRTQSDYVLAMAFDRPQSPARKYAAAELAYRDKQLAAVAETSQKNAPASSIAAGAGASPSALQEDKDTKRENALEIRANKNARPTLEGVAQSRSALPPAATPAVKAGPATSDEFRGIARRLHLPEDLQEHVAQSRPSGNVDVDAAGIAPAAVVAHPPPTAADDGVNEKSKLKAQGQGSSPVEAGQLADKINDQLPVQPSADKANQQPLVRVLFVLRAGNRAVDAAIADQIPAQPPASAALREAAAENASPAAAEVDESP